MISNIKQKLKNLTKNCYAPYSGIKVTCIIETYAGDMINGVNVENCAYGSTICAERSALTNFITQGYAKQDIKEIYLFSNLNKCITPCGACRQVMSELVSNDIIITMFSEKDCKRMKLSSLIPDAFSE